MTVFVRKEGFSPVPSVVAIDAVRVAAAGEAPTTATAVGVTADPGGEPPAGMGWDLLATAGFKADVGQCHVVPAAGGRATILVGLGDAATLDTAGLRDAAAAFARAAATHAELAIDVPDLAGTSPDVAAQAVVEGILLARYRYDALKSDPVTVRVQAITLVGAGDLEAGATRGIATAEAACIARDLANTPPALLHADDMAAVAARLGAERGLDVEVVGKDELIEMGCGGLLGVNAGSAEPPCMVKLTYRPGGDPTGRLTFVGKGITYDAGGIALKPADEVHATMKNDMSGAGAILGAMLQLQRLGCTAQVTGYLMCTDNRPSSTALAMGDVLTVRGGKSVEVANTDAEGRLVMADALVLATEEPTDAIVDIATLTGAAMRALGTQVAAVIGNHQGMVHQVAAAAATSDESVWQLPLERRYRRDLDSDIADIKNLGGANAGAITAALFLDEFVAGKPWAHIDIAGTAQNDRDTSWRPPGCTGFGARLLLDLALGFTPPSEEESA